MKITLSSLKRFIDFDLTVQEVADKLTQLGIEVDAILYESPPFSGIVVGQIKSLKKHPEADRLSVVEVDDGSQIWQVVCGAKNCEVEAKYPFAKIGAILDPSSDDPLKIKKSKLRGVESSGMLCASDELGFGGSHEGILKLPDSFELGANLLDLLWDPVLEVSLTPNLGHCMSVLGIARELATLLNLPVKVPKSSYPTEKPSTASAKIQDSDNCHRYCLKTVDGIEIKDSPFWLQHQLLLCGMNPINNIVDITNWVMLEMGQPMHAFDHDKISGNELVVQGTKEKTSLLCLDKEKRSLQPGALVITDKKGPVAVAGVIGGEESAISSSSKNIILEAAFFSPSATRSSMKDMALRTESGMRFEKGTDIEIIPQALARAAELLHKSCPSAKISLENIDIYPQKHKPLQLQCRLERVNQILGRKFSLSEIQDILQSLEFKVKNTGSDCLSVSCPSYRHDLFSEIDLISEIARVYGYDHFEKHSCYYRGSNLPNAPIYSFEDEVRRVFIQEGLQECITCDLISPSIATITTESSLPPECLIKTLHSKSDEHSILRPSLLPGLLTVLKHNQDRKNSDFYGFEIGNVHFKQGNDYVQQPMAAILLSGKALPSHWDTKSSKIDFFDLKGIFENVTNGLRIKNIALNSSMHPSFHPHRQANLMANDLDIGVLGQVHPEILEELSIREEVYFLEINLQNLLRFQDKKQMLRKLAIYPSSERDWTLTLQNELPISQVYDAVSRAGSNRLERVELIDLYTSEELGNDRKNVTFRFSYRDYSKTISYEDVENEHKKIIQSTTDFLKEHIIS